MKQKEKRAGEGGKTENSPSTQVLNYSFRDKYCFSHMRKETKKEDLFENCFSGVFEHIRGASLLTGEYFPQNTQLSRAGVASDLNTQACLAKKHMTISLLVNLIRICTIQQAVSLKTVSGAEFASMHSLCLAGCSCESRSINQLPELKVFEIGETHQAIQSSLIISLCYTDICLCQHCPYISHKAL